MAESDPRERLHLVEGALPGGASGDPRWRGRPRRLAMALGVLLVCALALSLWSRGQLQARIRAYDVQVTQLEGRLTTLESTLARRNRMLRALERRLGAVRSAVTQLRSLLDAPLESGAPPAP